MLLLGLYFGPSDLLDPQKSFKAIAGRLLVSPVVRTLVFSKIADEVSCHQFRACIFGTQSCCY